MALGAPIPLPGAIVAAPVNYYDHMVEMSEVRDIRHLAMFLKARSSVIGANTRWFACPTPTVKPIMRASSAS